MRALAIMLLLTLAVIAAAQPAPPVARSKEEPAERPEFALSGLKSWVNLFRPSGAGADSPPLGQPQNNQAFFQPLLGMGPTPSRRVRS